MRAHSGLRPPSFTEPKRSNTLRRGGDEIGAVREGETEMTDLRPDVDDEEARAPNAAEPEDEDAVNTDGFDTDGYRTRFVKDGDDGER